MSRIHWLGNLGPLVLFVWVIADLLLRFAPPQLRNRSLKFAQGRIAALCRVTVKRQSKCGRDSRCCADSE